MKNSKKCMLVLGLILAQSTLSLAQQNPSKNVYLFESLAQIDGLQNTDTNFCVKEIHASLPNYEIVHGGPINGASYNCQIKYEIQSQKDRQEQYARTASVQYVARPVTYEELYKLKDFSLYFSEKYKYFSPESIVPNGVFGNNPFSVAFAIPNSILYGVYQTAGIFSDVANEVISLFQTPLNVQKARLTPSFVSLRSAQMASCEVIALSLLDSVCEDKKSIITNKVLKRIQNIKRNEDLFNKMIPTQQK
ncbi:MAG: hypothetical protein ACOYOK_09235 [Pseudobdellovibrionaceae bacterium]